jgi:hypothetical protein
MNFLDNVFLEEGTSSNPTPPKPKTKGGVVVHYEPNPLDLKFNGNFKFEEPVEKEIKVIYIEPKQRKGKK